MVLDPIKFKQVEEIVLYDYAVDRAMLFFNAFVRRRICPRTCSFGDWLG